MTLTLWVAALLLVTSCGAEHHHAPCPPDSEAWRDGIPVVNCARSPPCVEETWTTVARCSGLRLDSSWPTWDPYLRRDPGWTSMRALLHDQARGKTLLVVGDSVARQSFAGLLCEASRHGLSLTTHGPRVHGWRERVAAVNASAWALEAPGGDVLYVHETDTLIARHWGSLREADTAGFLSIADIALVNFGLHYHDDEQYGAGVETLFRQLAAFNALPGKLAVFRETSMQAFYESGSYVAGAEKKTSRCGPVPSAAAHDNEVWRLNQVARSAALRHNVPLIGWYETTLMRWNMRHEKLCRVEAMAGRPDASSACAASNCTEACPTDCTHLCATPTLWAHFAHLLSVALSSKFPLSE